MKTLVRLFAFTTFATAAACSEPAAPRPETLADVRVPADFTFATTRAVGLSVSASAARTGPGAAGLTVARLDGKVLYRGPITADRPVELSLMVPTKDSELELTLSTGDGAVKERRPITEGSLIHAFD